MTPLVAQIVELVAHGVERRARLAELAGEIVDHQLVHDEIAEVLATPANGLDDGRIERAAADDHARVLVVPPAVPGTRVADDAGRPVREPDRELVLVEPRGKLDRRPIRPHPALRMRRARQLGRVREVPVGLSHQMLEVSRDPDRRDPRVAVVRPVGPGAELLRRPRAIGNEHLELEGAALAVLAHLPRAEAFRHVQPSHTDLPRGQRVRSTSQLRTRDNAGGPDRDATSAKFLPRERHRRGGDSPSDSRGVRQFPRKAFG